MAAPMLLTEEYLGWGVRQTDDHLCDAANALLEKIQKMANSRHFAALDARLPPQC
jgi:hypothetical protein